jgi:PrcB C-terminal
MVTRVLRATAAIVLAAVAPWGAIQLATSVRSGWTDPATVVITDSAGLRSGWARLFEGTSLRPPPPRIAFAKDRVVIVAAGTRPTGGFTLRFDSAAVVRDSALIWVTLHTPPPGCGVTQELTAPAVAIAMPREPAPLRVVTRERPDSVQCDGHT